MNNLKYYIPLYGMYLCVKDMEELSEIHRGLTAIFHGAFFGLLYAVLCA